MENKNNIWMPEKEYVLWKDFSKKFNEDLEKQVYNDIWNNDINYSICRNPDINVIIEKIPHI